MIYVFGSVLQLIRVETDKDQTFESFEFTQSYKNGVGGKGALQALSAARAGAKTALVGRTGDDELSKHILFRLRKHGVITSGVSKAEQTQTGTAIRLEHENRTIIALGASEKATADQIPEDVLTDRHIILLQTELGHGEGSKILQSAKAKGATTILNVSPRFDIAQDDIENLDYIILSAKYKDTLQKLCNGMDKNSLPTAIYISPDGKTELQVKGGVPASIPKAKLESLTWEYPEGYEDAFCGTFAAGLFASQPLDKVILKAHIAAALTASKAGGYDAIPYIDEVDQCVDSIVEQRTNKDS